MSELRPHTPVSNVQIFDIKGPWQTKSGGELSQLFNLPAEIIQSSFFQYDTDELAAIPNDVRGLRAYRVRDIPKGAVGANEWHKVRHELVFALSGRVRWLCEDVYGDTQETILDEHTGIWVKPGILHTYEALSSAAGLLVIANTLFNPNDPATHDTYSANTFYELQAAYSATQR